MITLRQLRYLSSLARHRHFGRAAEDCAVTQPALSMQVREMERESAPSWSSGGRATIALTETGLDVAERAEHILAATRDLVDFARHRDVLSGRAAARHHPDAGALCAAARAAAPAKGYPRLRLEVRETQTKLLLEELAAGALDCVMLALPADGADVEMLALFEDAFLLAVPASRQITTAASASKMSTSAD